LKGIAVFVKRLATKIGMSAAVFASVTALAISGSGEAAAASYAKEVKTPVYVNDAVKGRANVNTDCADTFGCYTYLKVEYLLDQESSPSSVPWLNQWQFGAGKWADNGWNDITFKVPVGKCATFRTVVDSYNDSPGDSIVGVSLGPVEFNLGGGVKRYHQTYTSGTMHRCDFI
jgi:hypothetical protein